MTGASLLLLLSLGQTATADPRDLVRGLGAPRFAEREAAAAALEQIGGRALPALRLARDQRDAEIRNRAAALITKIEGSLLTKPSQVTLDFVDVPVADAVRVFSEQSGIKLALIPENSPNWRNRRVTIHEPAPLPFWKAIDRLCESAHLQYNHAMHVAGNGREPAMPLLEGGVRSTSPVSDSGPFRVTVVSLRHQRDVSFPMAPSIGGAQGRSRAAINEQFSVQFQVAGEPRLALVQLGGLKINEAVDDHGNALAIAAGNGPEVLHRTAYFGFATGSVIQVQGTLNYPAQPGTTIKSLKGTVPVSVSTRKPNPLTITLAGALGRTFQNDDVAITVHELRLQAGNRAPSIELTIRPTGNSAAGSAGDGLANGPMMGARPAGHQQQIELTDAQGHTIGWYQSSFDVEAGRVTISFPAGDQAANIAELHYYGLVRASADVAFEFADLPMP